MRALGLRRIASAAAFITVVACGGGHDEHEVPIPTAIELDQGNLSLMTGGSTFLVATVYDQHYVPMPGAHVTWQSTNPGVATVTGGAVAAIAPGNAMIVASSSSVSASAAITVTIPQVTIVVTNQLARPVNVDVNGVVIGSVPAGQTAQQTVPSAPTITVGWTVVPFILSNGTPIGDLMSGVYAPVASPTGTLNYAANYQIGTQFFFAPAINNNTPAELLMGVNMGLQAENRCGCLVGPFASNVAIGYYRLFSNSNVRAYRFNSNYTGPFVFWPAAGTMPGVVTPGSGTVLLRADFAPTSGAQPGLVESLISTVAAESATGPEDQPREGRYRPQAPVLPAVRANGTH